MAIATSPDLSDIDLTDLETFVDRTPHDWFKRLRDEAPCYWQPEAGGRGFWYVTRYEDILALQSIVRRVPIADHVVDYALRLTRATRLTNDEAPGWVKEWLAWGAGPRSSQFLVLGSKARALLQGRFYVSAEDIRAVAKPVLRHRLVTSFAAEA